MQRRLAAEEAQPFWDQLWHDCKYGVLARGRAPYDEASALCAAHRWAELGAALRAAFGAPASNERDALEHCWGHLRGASRAGFEAAVARGEARAWLFAAAARTDASLANSRLLWDEPWPDRAWFGAPLRLGVAEGAGVLLLPLDEAEEAPDRAAVLLEVRVAGAWRVNPLLARMRH